MIAWTDIETTGLRGPRVEHILEVALVITDDDLNEKDFMDVVVLPTGTTIEQLIPTLDPYVQEMHTKNGLFDAVKEKGVPREAAEAMLIDFVKRTFIGVPLASTNKCLRCGKRKEQHNETAGIRTCPDIAVVGMDAAFQPGVEPAHKQTPLAGSTVGFDKEHLKEQMPGLVDLFFYRVIDVSSIGELAARTVPEMYALRPKAKDTHRALADVRGSIEMLRWWKDIGFIGAAGRADDFEVVVNQLRSLGLQVTRR